MPIIPDYLFSHILNCSAPLESPVKYAPASLSPLQRKFETLEEDNGPLGALLASKAFVQLAFTPVVGYLTQILDCSIPLLIGSCNMLVAALRKILIFFLFGFEGEHFSFRLWKLLWNSSASQSATWKLFSCSCSERNVHFGQKFTQRVQKSLDAFGIWRHSSWGAYRISSRRSCLSAAGKKRPIYVHFIFHPDQYWYASLSHQSTFSKNIF